MFRLIERRVLFEDLKIGPPVVHVRRTPYRIRAEAHAYDVVQAALEVWRIEHGTVDKRFDHLPFSPWQCAAEMQIGKHVVNEVLAAACEDGQYDRSLRETILNTLSLA